MKATTALTGSAASMVNLRGDEFATQIADAKHHQSRGSIPPWEYPKRQ
jgi:hypothetical protein